MMSKLLRYQLKITTADNVIKAVNNLKSGAKNRQLNGIILDLRNNPGGLLNEAVNVSNVFVDQGSEVVSTKGKIKDWNKHIKP